jgi:hypothetical protein
LTTPDYTAEFRKYIHRATMATDKPLAEAKYEIVDRGAPHIPVGLPEGKMGIYTFWHDGRFLKIGRAGPKNNARFRSQHYGFKARSTLAKSLCRGMDKK